MIQFILDVIAILGVYLYIGLFLYFQELAKLNIKGTSTSTSKDYIWTWIFIYAVATLTISKKFINSGKKQDLTALVVVYFPIFVLLLVIL